MSRSSRSTPFAWLLLGLCWLLLTPTPGLAQAADVDADGVPGSEDNCLAVANPSQLDADSDGYGNLCDQDLNNDGVVGGSDFLLFGQRWGSSDIVADFNGDGVVDGADFLLFGAAWATTPGPSGLACAGSVPCTSGPILEQGYVPDSEGQPMFATYEVQGDHVFYQGDMHFDLGTLRAYQEEVASQMQGGQVPQFNYVSNTWPNGEVVYDPDSIDVFDNRCLNLSDLDGDGIWDAGETCLLIHGDEIRRAITHWNDETDIVVRPKTDSDDHWFGFKFDPKLTRSCWSDLGYVSGWAPVWPYYSEVPQQIALGPNCGFGSVVHEIGHTVGLKHEQSRADRDDFVDVFWGNILSNRVHNFEIGGKTWGPYDYRSIMHYRPMDFGKTDASGSRLQTLASLVDLPNGELGQRTELSVLDILGADALAHKAQTGFMPADDRILYDGPVGYFPASGALPDAMRLGYIDSDPYPDLVGFRPGASDLAGEVVVARGSASGDFGTTEVWNPAFCHDSFSCELGDVTGDGLDDLVSFDSYQGDVVVAPSNGSSFVGSALWQVADRMPGGELRLADLNNDCVEDAVLLEFYDGILQPTRVRIYAALSGQAGFTPFTEVGDIEARQVQLADARNGGGIDLISADDDGDVRVQSITSTGIGNPTIWATGVCEGDVECKVLDVDGDNLVDLIAENPGANHPLRRLRILLSDGISFRTDKAVHHDMDCLSPIGCLYGDLDADGMNDDVVDPLGSPWEDTIAREVYTFVDPERRKRAFSTLSSGGPWCTPAPPPPNASPWVQVTDWPVAQMVGTRDYSYALRANEGTSGHTLLRNEADDSWTPLATNVLVAAATDFEVYVLTHEGSPVYRVLPNGSLQSLGGSFIHIEGGTTGLVAIESASVVKQWDCFCGGTFQPGWTTLPDFYFYPAGDDAMVVGGVPLNEGNDGGELGHVFRKGIGTVVSYDFDAMSTHNQILGAAFTSWDPISGIYAGGSKLYRTLVNWFGPAIVQQYTGNQHLSPGGTWTTIGDNVSQVVASPQTGNLFRLNGDKSEIHRYDGVGEQWTKIGGAADRLYFGSHRLYASSPGSGALFRLYVE